MYYRLSLIAYSLSIRSFIDYRLSLWPQEGRKWPQERPKMVLRWAEDGPKSDPKPQDEKRTEPRRSQERLGPPRGRTATNFLA